MSDPQPIPQSTPQIGQPAPHVGHQPLLPSINEYPGWYVGAAALLAWIWPKITPAFAELWKSFKAREERENEEQQALWTELLKAQKEQVAITTNLLETHLSKMSECLEKVAANVGEMRIREQERDADLRDMLQAIYQKMAVWNEQAKELEKTSEARWGQILKDQSSQYLKLVEEMGALRLEMQAIHRRYDRLSMPNGYIADKPND